MRHATPNPISPAPGRHADERGSPGQVSAAEYPVREYIAAMAVELAQMARWDGDETLGCALDVVTRLATEPAQLPEPVPTAVSQPQTRRRS